MIVGFQGDWLSDESVADSPWVDRAARDLGALAGGGRRWRDRAGPRHGRRRRPGRGGRALVMKAEPAPSTGPRPGRLTHPCVRCGAPVRARRRAVRALQPARAARLVVVAGPRHRDRRGRRVHRLPGHRRAARPVGRRAVRRLGGVGPSPTGAASPITLTVTNTGSGGGQTTCRVLDPADRTGSTGAVPAEPPDRARADGDLHPDRRPSSATVPSGRSPSSAARRDRTWPSRSRSRGGRGRC